MSARFKLTLVYVAGLIITTVALAVAVDSARDDKAYARAGRLALGTAELARYIILDELAVERRLTKVVMVTDSASWIRMPFRTFERLNAMPSFLVVAQDSVVFTSSALQRGLSESDWQGVLQGLKNLSDGGPAGVFPVSQGEVLLVALSVESGDRRVARVIAGTMVGGGGWSPEVLIALVVICAAIITGSAFIAWRISGSLTRRIDRIRSEIAAITDGRSLHRRLSTDVSGPELTALIETLNTMIARLESSFLALRRFTADASHELKTPLAVLRADVERAMHSETSKRERMVALEEALHETTRMADLVESLLTLARADEGRFELHREPVDLCALTQEVYETALILGEASNVHVSLPFTADVTVMGDRPRLRQLFLNLVTNAIKYTGAGGRVDIGLGRHPTTVTFAVRDTGMGIAAADLPHIFERFWRADRVRTRTAERSGVGLGLAISQWIAQAHHGTLTVSSRLGRGSLFTVTLPLDDVTVEESRETVKPESDFTET